MTALPDGVTLNSLMAASSGELGMAEEFIVRLILISPRYYFLLKKLLDVCNRSPYAWSLSTAGLSSSISQRSSCLSKLQIQC
jgi:hypothetical protein